MSKITIDERGTLIIEDGHVLYKNFSGNESQFNRAGDRNFCVFIDDPEAAEKLNELGWNVKIRQPRDEGDTVSHYIKVHVSYKFTGPKVYRHIGNSKNAPTFECYEDTVGELDKDNILSADLVIAPSRWSVNGKEGISGYLSTMHAIVESDPFYDKYADNLDISAPAEFPTGTK